MDDDKSGCCKTPEESGTPSGGSPAGVTMPPPETGPRQVPEHAVRIPGGRAYVGTSRPEIADDGEGPVRRVGVKPFLMGATSVTNAEVAAFVEATGHVSEAERWGWSFVFWANVPTDVGPTEGVVGTEWWRRVDGATWRNIHGPGTADDVWQPDHPVVHMSWHDAACCTKSPQPQPGSCLHVLDGGHTTVDG